METTEKEKVSAEEVKSEVAAGEAKEETVEKEGKKEDICLAGKCCDKKKLKAAVGIVLFLALIAGSYVFAQKKRVEAEKEALKGNVEKFIKENLVQPGTDISVKEISKEGSLYRIVVNIGKDKQAQEVPVYATADGKLFPSEPIDMSKPQDGADEQAAAPEQKEIPKKDVPEVELFVMSYCPYGTQIEKGIIPAIEALGNKVKFSLKFVDYAMHPTQGEVEENVRQYCIQKEEPAKLNAYLKCFLKKGGEVEAKSCLKTAGVNAAKNEACFKTADEQFEITKKKNDKSAWSGGQFPPFDIDKADNDKYGVKGSPTLILNGVEVVGAPRDSASLLKTICSGFGNEPKECAKELSATAPSPGFGEGAATGNAAASCATN